MKTLRRIILILAFVAWLVFFNVTLYLYLT